MKENVLAALLVVLGICCLLVATATSQEIDDIIQVALSVNDTAGAIILLNHEIEADPSYHVNYYRLGRIYYDQRLFDQAAEQLQKAIDKKGNFYEAYYYLGLSLIELGRLDEAQEPLEKGLRKSKRHKAWFENGTGLLAMAREQYADADRSFRRALAENESSETKKIEDLTNSPNSEADRARLIEAAKSRYIIENAEYHLNLGDANFYQGVPALAVAEYETALAIDTGSTEVYFHWAEACLEMKDYSCAIEKLRVVLSKDSTHAEAWNRAGGIYFKAARSSRDRQERAQRFMDAIGSYQKHIDLTGAVADSSTVRGFFESAMAYANLRRYEDAARFFEQVLAIPFVPKDMYFYYGKSLWGTKDYVQAGEMLLNHEAWVAEQNEEYSSRIRPDELNKLLGDAFFYRKPKQFSSAVKYYRLSLDARPGQKRLLQNTAVAYHNLKRYGEAIEFYDLRIAEGMDSNAVSIYKNAAMCALSIAGAGIEEEEELEDEEEEEIALPGVDPSLNYYEVALGYLKIYLEQRPNDTAIVERVANTYLYQMSDCVNGVAAFERLVAMSPDNCQAQKSLGFAYFGGDICAKNLSKTLTHLLAAQRCLAGSEAGACSDPALIKWIAQAYHLRAVDGSGDSNSDYKNAFEWYGKVLTCDPGDQEAKKGQEDTRFEYN